MTKTMAWINAFRLRTLPLALSSILMGSFLAAYYNVFQWHILLGASMTTLFLQVLSNLANDYGDTENGADHDGRQGPLRMVQSGVISRKQMRIAIVLFSILSLLSGIVLLYVAFKGIVSINGIIFLILGLTAIGAALKYTMGKNPYGYKGMGDVFVLLFFGLLGVEGSFFLYSGWFSPLVLLPALSVGMLSAGVLNLNNLRDQISDKDAGKNTLVVRYGRRWGKQYQYALVIVSFILLILFVVLNHPSASHFVFLLSVPLFVHHLYLVFNAKEPRDFDPQLKKLALSTFALVLLFGCGLLL